MSGAHDTGGHVEPLPAGHHRRAHRRRRAVRQHLPAAADQPRRPPRVPGGDGRPLRLAGADGRRLGDLRDRAQGRRPDLEAGRRHQPTASPRHQPHHRRRRVPASRPRTRRSTVGAGWPRTIPSGVRPWPRPTTSCRTRPRSSTRATTSPWPCSTRAASRFPIFGELRPVRLLPPAPLRPRAGAAGHQAEHRAGQGTTDTRWPTPRSRRASC